MEPGNNISFTQSNLPKSIRNRVWKILDKISGSNFTQYKLWTKEASWEEGRSGYNYYYCTIKVLIDGALEVVAHPSE